MYSHPDRHSTPIPAHLARILTPAAGTLPPRALAQDAWLHLKEAQRLEDGTSARITPDRLMRLERTPNYWPASTSADQKSSLDAAIARALPATRAAIQAALANKAQ